MTLDEARKTILQEAKKKENFMLINIGYDNNIVLPYQDGVALMSSLAAGEFLEGRHSGTKKCIVPIPEGRITVSYLSRHEYQQIKIANLLGISVSDLELQEEQAKNASQDFSSP